LQPFNKVGPLEDNDYSFCTQLNFIKKLCNSLTRHLIVVESQNICVINNTETNRNITMKTVIRWLLVAGILLQFLCSPLYAGYEGKITRNQIRAREYIAQLQNCADPNKLERPQLRRDKRTKMKRSVREINKAMDEAEALARAGKCKLIKQPMFTVNGVPEAQYEREKSK
jgi:hypothetical protein